jgi:hypothetical protein
MFNFCLKGEIPTTLNEKGMASLPYLAASSNLGTESLKRPSSPKCWCSWCGLLSLRFEASPWLVKDPGRRKRHRRQWLLIRMKIDLKTGEASRIDGRDGYEQGGR